MNKTARRWNKPNLLEHDLISFLNGQLEKLEALNLELLPVIHSGKTMFVASDYAGQHGNYEILSYVFTDQIQFIGWEIARQRFRRIYLSDGRRMSFKGLTDPVKQKALIPFLSAANNIGGLSITIAIDHSIKDSIVQVGNPFYSGWKPLAWKRMFRIIGFLSFFIAGLSRPDQNLLWITDEDEIVTNDERVEQIKGILAAVSSRYLTHKMDTVQCISTSIDNEDRQLEDFAAVPDFVAGALSEVLREQHREGVMPQERVVSFIPEVSPKTSKILKWFSDSSQPLKRLVCLIYPGRTPNEIAVGWPNFIGLPSDDAILLPNDPLRNNWRISSGGILIPARTYKA